MKKILLFLLLGLLPQLIHAQTAKAIWCSGNTTLYFTYDTNTYTAGGTYDGQTITSVYNISNNGYYSSKTRPWYSIIELVTKVVIDSSFALHQITSLAYFFQDFKNLTSITGGECLVNSNVISLSRAFESCSSLTELDASNWDTSNVKNMYYTFFYCSSLTLLDVSNWDTSNVTNMECTFQNCSSLTSLDVSNWKTSKVTNLNSTFFWCLSLTELDVSNWDISNVTSMGHTFYNCNSLTSLGTDNVKNWNTSKVTNMSATFGFCDKLTSLDVSNWDTSNVTSLFCTFNNCVSLTELDVSNWDTSNVESLSYTFFGCGGVTSLDVSKWNTSKVTSMQSTFQGCWRLTSLDVAKKTITKDDGTTYDAWDTSNVTTLSSTFENCKGLISLDVSNWDTSNVTDFSEIFYFCGNLTELDVSNWDTSKVTSMGMAFYGCSKLTSLTFGKDFSTAALTGIPYNPFNLCYKLRYIDFYASDDTDAITEVNRSTTSSMFSGVPATTVIYLPHGSQDVTDVQNVVYSYGGDENDLRCPEYYSEDKVDIEFPRDFKTHKAIYQRTMANNYGSVILPYDFTTNDKVQAYTLDEEHTETMYFRDTQTVPAHTPFAFNVKQKGSGNVVDFTMADSSNSFGITVKATHTTHPDEKGWDGVAGAPYSSNTNLTGWTAKGYYVNQTIEKTDPLYSDLHYIAGEKFYKAAGETLIFPPHRVTFHGTWAKGNTSSGAKSFVFAASSDEVVTAIEEAETRQTLRDAEAIYDLAGRRQHEAQKGVNIVRMKDGSVRKMFVK